MAKMESSFKNMVLTLLAVTLVSATSLGYIYELTKEPIEVAKLNKKIEAIKQVVPAFNNNPNDDMYQLVAEDGSFLEAYPAKMNDSLVGTAIKTFTKKGFSGDIWLMAGFAPDGSIINISVLEHKETPGLGTKMDDADFKAQFKEKNPQTFKLSIKKEGGDVDAITAATISTRAFCDAVSYAYTALMKGEKKQ